MEIFLVIEENFNEKKSEYFFNYIRQTLKKYVKKITEINSKLRFLNKNKSFFYPLFCAKNAAIMMC